MNQIKRPTFFFGNDGELLTKHRHDNPKEPHFWLRQKWGTRLCGTKTLTSSSPTRPISFPTEASLATPEKWSASIKALLAAEYFHRGVYLRLKCAFLFFGLSCFAVLFGFFFVLFLGFLVVIVFAPH